MSSTWRVFIVGCLSLAGCMGAYQPRNSSEDPTLHDPEIAVATCPAGYEITYKRPDRAALTTETFLGVATPGSCYVKIKVNGVERELDSTLGVVFNNPVTNNAEIAGQIGNALTNSSGHGEARMTFLGSGDRYFGRQVFQDVSFDRTGEEPVMIGKESLSLIHISFSRNVPGFGVPPPSNWDFVALGKGEFLFVGGLFSNLVSMRKDGEPVAIILGR